ncbi:zinc-ribbon domain-containing protein [Paraburkholderia sp. J63]|uniref:zinc-ribbon domain-containing protein n=1 Tax=Paraburkholderia sp. J63 TaxID=2805434 RepID=UPI002ABE1E29|nr:zinc-ribbon domain-containing protein [Paraburkholderia sp. J63]
MNTSTPDSPGQAQPDADESALLPEHPSLAKLYRRAAEFGWRCLTSTWRGYQTRYEFACVQGHRFERHAATVFYQAEAPACRGCEADTIRDRWMAMLVQHGGELVDGRFTGLLDRYRLRCAKGHEWEAQGRKISEGSWCPRCAAQSTGARLLDGEGLAKLQAAAQEKGGRCLSTDYLGSKACYEWQYAPGHRWQSSGSHILQGHWCPQCAAAQRGLGRRRADGLEALHAAARQHGGECLETAFVGTRALYRFRCAAGHEWKTSANLVLKGHWCSECAWQKQRLPMDAMQQLAASRGGRCLSEASLGAHRKLTWECHRGHVWSATPASVYHGGSWCPSCANLERSKKRRKRLKYDFEG